MSFSGFASFGSKRRVLDIPQNMLYAIRAVEERARMKNYETFLSGAHEDLVEMLRECEVMEFHHKPVGSSECEHYNRVRTLLGHLSERIEHWNGHAKTGKAITTQFWTRESQDS